MNNLTERESGTSSEQSKFLALFQTVFCTSSVTLLTLSHRNQLGIQIGVEIFKYLFLYPERHLSGNKRQRYPRYQLISKYPTGISRYLILAAIARHRVEVFRDSSQAFKHASWLQSWSTWYTRSCFVAKQLRELTPHKNIKIFRHNPCIFQSMYSLWLHCLFLFSLNFNLPSASLPKRKYRQKYMIDILTTFCRRRSGNGAVEVSFESRTAQMSALFHVFTCKAIPAVLQGALTFCELPLRHAWNLKARLHWRFLLRF